MHTNRRFQLDAEGLAGVMGSLDHIVDIAGFGDACRRHAGGSWRLTLSVRCTQGSFQKCTFKPAVHGIRLGLLGPSVAGDRRVRIVLERSDKAFTKRGACLVIAYIHWIFGCVEYPGVLPNLISHNTERSQR
jgi:hypothetical protein